MVDLAEGHVDPEELEDDEDAYCVLAFDPGGTTGWALFAVHPDAMGPDPDIHVFGRYGNLIQWTAGEFTGPIDEQVDEAIDLISVWPTARIIAEAFKLRQLNADLAPVEFLAAMRWGMRPRRFADLQQPALAKSTLTDDRQKSLGLWIPGKEHARDAIKHGYTYLKRQKIRAVQAGRRA